MRRVARVALARITLVAIASTLALAKAPAAAHAEDRHPVIWVEDDVVYAAWGEDQGARPDRRAAVLDSTGAAFDTLVVVSTLRAVSALRRSVPLRRAAEARWVVPIEGVGVPPRGHLAVALGALPTTLDPAFATSLADKQIATQMFEGLVRFESRSVFSFDDHPDGGLAVRYERAGEAYRFHLRPDARFHDGRPVRAEDVRASLERALSPGLGAPRVVGLADAIEGGRDYLQGGAAVLTGVTVVDSLTVDIRPASLRAPLLAELAAPAAFIVPVERAGRPKADPGFARAPVGTGPFRFARADANGVLLVAAPGRGGGPDSLTFRFERSPQAAALDFELGRLDVVSLSEADAKEIVASGRAYPLPFPQPEASTYYLGFDVRRPFLIEREHRRALAGALDRALAVRVLVPGRGTLADGLLPPALRDARSGPDPWLAPRALAEAAVRAFARQAPELQFWLPSGSPTGLRVAEFVAATYRRLGLRVAIVERPWAEFEKGIDDGRADLFFLSWFADGPDPIAFVSSMVESRSRGRGGNRTYYSNAQVDLALEAARAASSEQEARSELFRAETLALADAPLLPLYHSVNVTFLRVGVAGIDLGALGAPLYDRVEVRDGD